MVASVPKRFILALFAIAGLAPSTNCVKPPAPQKSVFEKVDKDTVRAHDLAQLEIIKAEEKNFPMQVDLPGRVVIADNSIIVISSRVAGRVEKINVTAGDAVEIGTELLQLWSPDLVTAGEELKFAREGRNPALLRLTLEKLKAIGVSPKDVELAGRQNRNSYPLRSPAKGVVLERKINSGSSVGAGDVMMSIGKTDSYQFQGEVLPEQSKLIAKDMDVEFKDYPNLKASVESVSPVADPVSRLVKVRCRFKDMAPANLIQETLMNARITYREEPSLVAPAKALIRSNDGDYIFIKDGTELFHRILIELEGRTPTQIAIKPQSNFGVGREIVANGALLLNSILDEGD